MDTLGQRNRLVGFSWSALKEAFYSEQACSLLVIDYHLLSSAPEKVLSLVYQFLGEPYFEHALHRSNFDALSAELAKGLSVFVGVDRAAVVARTIAILE